MHGIACIIASHAHQGVGGGKAVGIDTGFLEGGFRCADNMDERRIGVRQDIGGTALPRPRIRPSVPATAARQLVPPPSIPRI